MRISEVKAGDVLEWEETLCRHRGTYRVRRIEVLERKGRNILTNFGNWIYWGDYGLGNSTTKKVIDGPK